MTLYVGKKCLFYKHGMTNTPTWNSWVHMKSRCRGQGGKKKWYQDRGIKYPTRWESFKNFLCDMGERPDGCTLDRIDNNKSYSKNNCRWVPMSIQNRNRTSNRYYEYEGRKQCLSDWASEFNISITHLSRRLSSGVDFERAIKTPTRKIKIYKYNGFSGNLFSLAKRFGVASRTAYTRIKLGADIAKALSTSNLKYGELARTKGR